MTQQEGEDPSIFAVALETLAVKANGLPEGRETGTGKGPTGIYHGRTGGHTGGPSGVGCHRSSGGVGEPRGVAEATATTPVDTHRYGTVVAALIVRSTGTDAAPTTPLAETGLRWCVFRVANRVRGGLVSGDKTFPYLLPG